MASVSGRIWRSFFLVAIVGLGADPLWAQTNSDAIPTAIAEGAALDSLHAREAGQAGTAAPNAAAPAPATMDSSPRPPITGVYRGKLGNRAVVLEIASDAQDDQPIEGQYFFDDQAIIIPVEGDRRASDILYLDDEDRNQQKTGGQWMLDFSKGKIAGQWCQCNIRKTGRGQPVALTRIADTGGGSEAFSQDSPTVGDQAESDPAFAKQLLAAPLAAGKDIKAGSGIAYAMQTDKRFDVSLPRLTKFPDTAVMKKVNDDLAKQQDDLRLEASACISDGRRLEGSHLTNGSWSAKFRIALLTRELLSISSMLKEDCGPDHPQIPPPALVYNLDTGEHFDTGDLIDSFDPSPSLTGLYTSHRGKVPEECGKTLDDDTNMTFYFDQAGLVMTPEMPSAMAACGPQVVIPYSALPPLANGETNPLRNLWKNQK